MKTDFPNPEGSTLFRPVGLRELELIHLSGMKAFPPRLPEQPIFYPVLNREYAEQIARDWNTKDVNSGYAGFVLEFRVDAEYLQKFEVQTVGGRQHQELWIPAEDLEEFNRHILEPIQIVEAFQGAEANLELTPGSLVPTAWQPMPDPKLLFTGRHCRLQSVNGWEYVERIHPSGVVAILAITDDQKIILVEQFRPPLGKNVIELPAGLAGDIAGQENENFAIAAQRELLEETGYQAAQMDYLITGPTSAGLTNEMITFFRARKLRRLTTGGGDGSENIKVHEVPLRVLNDWIMQKSQEGCEVDYKIYAALYLDSRPE